MEKINFTPKDIVNKHFKPKMRGYDPADVDEFLDDVIKDYETYSKETQRLEMENDRLVSKVDELTKQLAVGKSGQTARPSASVTNMDILKRLSNLERHVFGAQLNDDMNQDNRF
ncbi:MULTISPECIES: cell division regulator GpsB [Liquorilactobacillus]|uniref:Cell cycle protein GpsB n=2 Tax=Liquorilactobacillus TaxID=2767888 RepID=A0A023CX31_9LACO|nr:MULTISPECIES: cell division regulator GpsB [Liquorilactobacillus]KRN06206.1 cell division protein GpsB [Liquorilactobacillus sucicola DSM 21376 = JCM 15457]GAJ26136.1 cell division protein GpsB [Liquorilactobacillus sucicola DSM 21376 = JCM 15457]